MQKATKSLSYFSYNPITNEFKLHGSLKAAKAHLHSQFIDEEDMTYYDEVGEGQFLVGQVMLKSAFRLEKIVDDEEYYLPVLAKLKGKSSNKKTSKKPKNIIKDFKESVK